MRLILFLLLSIYCCSGFAKEIAIFDTDLCLDSLKVPQNFSLQDLSKKSFRCDAENKASGKRIKQLARHGENVLKRVFSLYKQDEKVTVYYFSVFEKRSLNQQRIKEALSLLKDKPLEFILFAGGLPLGEKIKEEVNLYTSHLMLVASGQIGRGIKKDTILWPQNSTNRKLIIGYYKQLKSSPKEKIFAEGQLNEKEAFLFLPHVSKNSELKYSSLAVASFAGLALQHCQKISSKCFQSLLKREVIDERKVRVLKEAFLNEI